MPPPRRRFRPPAFVSRAVLRRAAVTAFLALLALSLSALLLLYSSSPRLSTAGAASWVRRAWGGQAERAAEDDGRNAQQGAEEAARRRQLWARGRPFQGEGGRLWPGRVWLDAEGRRIQAHGGGVLYVAGERRYYWYGENKEGETYKLKGSLERVDVVGISCYSSSDLLHWTPHGVVLPPDTHDPASDLHVSRVMERPKVLFHAPSQRYVMWLHVDDADYQLASTGVAVSSKPQGPFTYMGRFRPNGQESRDMTVFQDDDGAAYVVYASEMNAVLHIARLTPDYLDVDGAFVRRFVGHSREAPALFKYQRHYFMVTSACTGWDPNEAQIHVATHMMGAWHLLGAPCSHAPPHRMWLQQGGSGDSKWHPTCSSTFESQGTFVLPLPNAPPGVFLFLGDRWNKHDLADSRYVWLPLQLLPNASSPRLWGLQRGERGGMEAVSGESGTEQQAGVRKGRVGRSRVAVARAVITWNDSWHLPHTWLHKPVDSS